MADHSQKPVEPVPPDGMELIVYYKCPHCGRHTPVPAPTEPRMLICEGCRGHFPIIPIDEHGLQYIRIILAGGKAAGDPDFL